MTLQDRIRIVLDQLLRLTAGAQNLPWDHGSAPDTDARHRHQKVGAMKASQMSSKTGKSPPPPGINLGLLDSDLCPPLHVSPYAHFQWRFKHADDDRKRLLLIHAAERFLLRMENPRSPRSDDDELYMRQGVRPGEEVQETVLRDYAGYDSDTVDILEQLKPGTTRKIRKDNFCDELGERKGVPPWAYREFEILDEYGGMYACMDRFQIAQSTYYDVKRKIKNAKLTQ